MKYLQHCRYYFPTFVYIQFAEIHIFVCCMRHFPLPYEIFNESTQGLRWTCAVPMMLGSYVIVIDTSLFPSVRWLISKLFRRYFRSQLFCFLRSVLSHDEFLPLSPNGKFHRVFKSFFILFFQKITMFINNPFCLKSNFAIWRFTLRSFIGKFLHYITAFWLFSFTFQNNLKIQDKWFKTNFFCLSVSF